MHLVYPPPPPKFCITIVFGMTVKPKGNWKQWLCKILGGKQGTLWSM